MATRLREGGERPDAGGCWSTAQVIGVCFSDLHSEKVRETRERADALGLKNAAARSELLPRASLEAAFLAIAAAIAQTIQGSGLSKASQADVMRSISAIPIVIRDVAASQSRNGNNGADHNGEKPKKAGPRKAVGS
jgi:phage terminase Nu1 subunit (DNA packaging protein)